MSALAILFVFEKFTLVDRQKSSNRGTTRGHLKPALSRFFVHQPFTLVVLSVDQIQVSTEPLFLELLMLTEVYVPIWVEDLANLGTYTLSEHGLKYDVLRQENST